MDVSIIIVNYNTRELLKQCIESIYATIGRANLSYEIIVTDNNSSDGSAEMLEHNFPGVILIKSKINGGFAYANNLGIKKSSGKYIFLLNSDTIVLKDVIYRMYQYMEQNKWVGILGPELLNADLTHQTSISAFPTLFREFAHIYEMKNILKIPFVKHFLVKFGGKLGSKDIDQYMKNFQNLQQPEKVQVLVGAAMFIRREVFEQVGYLDENYFMYYEEIDYCYQCYKAGWPCVYNPIGQIIHLIGQSSKKISEKTFYIRYKSMMYYFNKNHGKLKAVLVRINLILGLTFRIIFTMLHSLVKSTEGRLQAIRIYYKTILIACGSKKYDGARS
jgi:GT2 family glycosyltransferase